jgi:nitrate reductase gamma subunit
VSQSKSGSLVESIVQTLIGAVIGLLTQVIVFPLYGMEINMLDQLGILGIFTVVGTIRSYLIRRLFDRKL